MRRQLDAVDAISTVPEVSNPPNANADKDLAATSPDGESAASMKALVEAGISFEVIADQR